MAQPSPAQRRVLVGVTPAEDERSRKLGGQYKITAPDGAEVVLIDDLAPSADPMVQALIDSRQLVPGAILIQSPYRTGRFADLQDAELTFEREHLQLVSHLAQLLGATHVKSNIDSLEVKKRSTTSKLTFGKKLGRVTPYKGDVTATTQHQEKWSSKLSIEDRYPGGEPDIESALEFAKRHAFSAPDIVSLVDSRAAANRLSSRSVKVTYDGTRDHDLQVAAAVHLPQGSLNLTVNQKRSHLRRISLDLLIEFPT